jgi:hypothetical protein
MVYSWASDFGEQNIFFYNTNSFDLIVNNGAHINTIVKLQSIFPDKTNYSKTNILRNNINKQL